MNEKIMIDGHAHACGEYLTAKAIEQKLSAANVDTVLLTPGQYGSKTTYRLKNLAQRNPLGDVVSRNNRITSRMISLIGAIKQIPKGNEYVYQLKCALPNRVKQCYWVTRENWENVQQDYERMRFDAVKFHQCWEKFDFEDVFFTKTVEWASEKEIPVFVHIRDLAQVDRLIVFIRKHPKAIMVIGHLYGVELFMREEKQYFENTYFDLSNFYFVSQERAMLAYKQFGAGHLLMGSDTPYGKQSLEQTIQQISQMQISLAEREQILGLNLARLLKL
ncbi:MAG: TatD family hydrolase [Oscillospiraceae bacterium]|nr:TatD family hydrolase [Oscillospiraceae bacterium]